MSLIEYKAVSAGTYNNWQAIDVVVSRDCTLRCEYCYLHKHPDNHYDMDAVLTSVDKLLNYYHSATSEDKIKPGVVLGLYPEPWVDIQKTQKLIVSILRLLRKYPKFVTNYMIMLGTNGVKLHEEIPILNKIKSNLAVNVTLDGIKEQHDMYRVFADGSPSWDIVRCNVLKYQDKYNIYETKVTIGPGSIKYIFDSVTFLWNDMGMNDVNINVVFEDLWGDKEEKRKHLHDYEDQLEKLYHYILDNDLVGKKYVSLICSRNIPFDKNNAAEFQPKPYCGAAMMRSIDVDGGIYPCFRLSPYSLNEESPFRLENTSFTEGSVRALNSLNSYDACPQKCLECSLLRVCSMCVGGAWEEKKSLFWRTIHHCEFKKLQTKWAVKLYEAINGEITNDDHSNNELVHFDIIKNFNIDKDF